MLFIILSVFYILVAVAMIVLILLQNGAGAGAGSGFGGGASATVFGARGSGTFLTRATGVLAAVFFVLSILMGIILHGGTGEARMEASGLGVMAGVVDNTPGTEKVATPAVPVTGSELPTAVPAATTPASSTPAATPAKDSGEVPAATDPAKN